MNLPDFPHTPPEGYVYEYESFNTRLISIWLRHLCSYDYNLGKSVRSIWGFYSPKKREYYSPVNSKTSGKVVSIERTTPYTAMIPKLTSLEKAFV